MRTGNDERLQERGKDKGTKDAHPVVQDIDYAGEDVTDQVAERAEHGEQGDVSKNQGNGRDKDERNDLGDVLLGNLFDLGHKPGSQDCGNTPPWKATMGMDSGPKFQYSAPVGSITNVLRFIRLG